MQNYYSDNETLRQDDSSYTVGETSMQAHMRRNSERMYARIINSFSGPVEQFNFSNHLQQVYLNTNAAREHLEELRRRDGIDPTCDEQRNTTFYILQMIDLFDQLVRDQTRARTGGLFLTEHYDWSQEDNSYEIRAGVTGWEGQLRHIQERNALVTNERLFLSVTESDNTFQAEPDMSLNRFLQESDSEEEQQQQ